MRNAINQNRTTQLALLGVLALVGGFMLLKSKGGGESTAATPPPATATGTTPPAATGVPAATTATPVVSGATAGGAAVPANLIPGPGLPKGLLAAYDRGDGVVLLVRRAGGIDDRLVRSSVERLSAVPDLKVYVTKAKGIARYSWLTQGVNVSELPALIVLRPKKLTNGTPTATVSYGFRNSESAVQAVEDALYQGPSDRPYHP